MPKIKEGFYWIFLELDKQWTIAEYDNDYWYFIGNDEGFKELCKGDIIGEKIEKII